MQQARVNIVTRFRLHQNMNTPQTCLDSFFQALVSKDSSAARTCVFDAKPDPRVDELFHQFPSAHPTLLDVRLDGDTAEAKFLMDDNSSEPWHCRFKLSGGDWFLYLKRSVDELLADGVYEPERSLDPLLVWFVYPDRFEELKIAACSDSEHKACRSNVRILTHHLWNSTTCGQGHMTEENWREAIRPSLPKHPNDHDWFSCPVTGEPYSLNFAALTSRNPEAPLVYEGQDRQLSFAHQGKSSVGFCSGSVRFVGPDEELRW